MYQLLSAPDTFYNINRKHLALQNQEYFDIGPRYRSPSGWEHSISILNDMDDYSLPCEKIRILLKVVRNITTTYTEEHGEGAPPLAADDFLPIFIYVISHSSISNATLMRQLICETMVHSISVGLVGYFVTMLEAAVEYIASLKNEGTTA